MAITKTRKNSQEPNSITKNNIIILNDQEVHLNNITLIDRKDYTKKSQKNTTLQLKPTTLSQTINHKEQKKTLKNNVDLNSVVTPTTDKCFHSLILTIYNPILRVITAKKHSNTTSSGLVGWGFPIRTEDICEYVVVNVTPKKQKYFFFYCLNNIIEILYKNNIQ